MIQTRRFIIIVDLETAFVKPRASLLWNIFKSVYDCFQNIYIYIYAYLGIERVEKVRLELRK